MRLFRKRRPDARPSKRRLPKRQLAPVEEIVEQGLLVADVAVRMSTKNAIIMNALRNDVDFHRDNIAALVREATEELALERERDAAHIARVLSEIRSTGRSAWSEGEYGGDDNATLRHRQEVYEGVAAQLHERAKDDVYVYFTAERARAAAWGEIGDSIVERASHPYYSGGATAEYQESRGPRIQQLIEKDLRELTQQHRGDAALEKPKRRWRRSRAQ